ncbi:Zinc fingerRING/FYVE/PHD-type [Penicillium lividum]|nr:Zinc fingerRING/FYVE/PHD-type [Penicillium lividum]
MMYSTPARQRVSQSRAPSSAQSRTQSRASTSTQQRQTFQEIEIPELPPYEASEGPLTGEASRMLARLLEDPQYKALKTHIDHAIFQLTESAGQVNERLCDAQIRCERAKEKRRNESAAEGKEYDSDENENEETERLGAFERSTGAVTGQMDEKVRAMIDLETKLLRWDESIKRISKEEEDAQRAALGPRMTRRQARQEMDGEDGEDGDDSADEDFEGTPSRGAAGRSARNPVSQKLNEDLETGAENWNELSLTDRYASHNSYVGFYRMVHDAKFPNEEAPPLPHSSTWFEHLEGSRNASGSRNQSTRSRRNPEPESDDDIVIQRERISLKCPLTLLPYREPVTSQTCSHSFESEAIYSMIAGSSLTIPGGPERGSRRIRAVKCPVCSTVFSANDLRPDPVLLRRVKRAEELAAREAEDNMEERSHSVRRPNEVTLASDAIDSDMDVDVDVDVDEAEAPVPSARVKSEPMDRAMSTGSEETADDESDESEGKEESEEE